METVGIVGLGAMGRPVGRHLMAAGFAVVGCDPAPAAAEAAREEGIEVLSAPADVAGRADLVLVLVGFDSEVEMAFFGLGGLLGGARPGLAVAIGATVAPAYATGLADRLADRDIHLLDLPSARGQDAVERGEVLLFGGGAPEVFDRWRPAFETFASDIFHLGPFGAGQVAKMANNMILWACMSANDEALRLGAALGVDTEALRAALCASSAQNWSLTTRAETRPMPWAEKDMRIALAEADRARLSLPLAACAGETIKAYKVRHGIPTPAPRGTE